MATGTMVENNTAETNRREWRERGRTPAPAAQNDSLGEQLAAAQRRLDIVSRQLDGMSRRVDGISYTVEQIKPAADRTLSDHQMVQAVLQSAETLALQVQALVSKREHGLVDADALARFEMQRHHLRARTLRQQQVEANLSYIERLEKCQQEITEQCTCGQHRGIRFLEQTTLLGVGGVVEKTTSILEDNLCPKHWWVMQSRLALKRGKLSEFTRSYPFADYLFAYSVG